MASEREALFNQKQYDMLKRCSDAKDISEWNEWRLQNQDEVIYLEKADFTGFHLQGANLCRAFLHEANFSFTVLKDAEFLGSYLDKAKIFKANLSGVKFFQTSLTEAKFVCGEMRNTYITNTNFQGATFEGINLQGSVFRSSNMEGVTIGGHFEAKDDSTTKYKETNLKGARFSEIRFDSGSSLSGFYFDRDTDFGQSNLDLPFIPLSFKVALKNNIRRIEWAAWARRGKNRRQKCLRWVINNTFWAVSDYGSSTAKIIKWLLIVAAGFGIIYWLFAIIPGSQSIIADLKQVCGQPTYSCVHTLARSIYFSIVTMTTLGFGDMHASDSGGWESYAGYFVLSIQVVISYVLLGALITRLGILFNSDAPAAKPKNHNGGL